MKKQQYYQLIPEKVLYAVDAIEAIIKPQITGYHRDNLLEVVSVVAKHVRKDDEHTPLKAEYLKALVPQGHTYLARLVDLGVVERTGPYIVGETSYKYNFNKQYKSRYIRQELDNPALIRRIRSVFEKLKKRATKTTWGRSEQLRDLNRLSMGAEWQTTLNKGMTIDQWNYVTSSAHRIINGEITYSVDATSGRFHSNVTNMPKELRQHLRINGQPLVNVDIKNSQPYLSTIILTDPSKVSHLTTSPAFASVLQSLKVIERPDVKLYVTLTRDGGLYEHLMDIFARADIPHTRDQAKRQLLRILFSPNRTPSNAENKAARKAFRQNFPTVHSIFNKVRGNSTGARFVDYRRFAILLQAIESHLMLDVVLKIIRHELPDAIAITVHDSVMTGVLTDNVEAVKQIIEREFTRFVGIKPAIKVEGIDKAVKNKKHPVLYN